MLHRERHYQSILGGKVIEESDFADAQSLDDVPDPGLFVTAFSE